MPRPFAIIGLMVFFVLAALYDASSEAVLIVFVTFVVLLLLSVVIKKFRNEHGIQALLASAAAACLLILTVNLFWYEPQIKIADTEHQSVILITDEAERKYGNYYYEAKATEIDGEKADVRLRLVFFAEPDISPYDEIRGSFHYYRLGTSSESLLASYKSQNRFLGAYSADGDYNIIKTGSHRFGRFIVSLRSGIKNSIMSVLPNDYGALGVALVLGDKSLLSDEAYSALKNAGITHVICVSGLHLSLWSSAVLWILKKLKIKEKHACLISVPAVVFIMFLTGMTNSVVRAGIMMILYLVSKVLSRRSDSLNSLGISILVISCINPYAAGSVSFQLSVLATLGVIICSEFIMPRIDEAVKEHNILAYVEKPLRLLTVTAFAVFFTVPVTLTVYHSFSLAVFPSNLLIVGFAEACMMASAAGAAIAFFTTSIPNLPAFTAGVLAKCILKIASVTGGLSLGRAYVSERDAYLIIAFFFIVSAVFLAIYFSGKKRAAAAFAVLPVIFIITVYSFSYIDSLGTSVRVLDVEEGKNILISYRGENILIGCSGDDGNGLYEIENAADRRGGVIDTVVVPGRERVNASYLKDVINKYNPSGVYCGNADYSVKLLISDGKYVSDADKCSTENIRITSVRDKDGNEAFVAETKEIKAVIFFDDIDASSLDCDISSCNIVILCGDKIPAANFSSLSSLIVCADGETGAMLQKSLASSGINASVTAGYGDIEAYAYKNRITIERG